MGKKDKLQSTQQLKSILERNVTDTETYMLYSIMTGHWFVELYCNTLNKKLPLDVSTDRTTLNLTEMGRIMFQNKQAHK